MKNACIIVRDKYKGFDENEFESPIRILQSGGIFADKILIITKDDEHEFAQTIIECKNFFDNVFIIAEDDSMSAIHSKAVEILKAADSTDGIIRMGKKLFFCIPFGQSGISAVKSEVLPVLFENSGISGEQFGVIRAYGVPKDRLDAVLNEAKEVLPNGIFSTDERYGDLRIQYLYGDASKTAVDEAEKILVSGLNEYIYSLDDTPLNQQIYELLKLRNLHLSIAESFTGGGIASKMIEISGVSEVLHEGIVSYSNSAKQKRLGVLSETLSKLGAVSDQTAYEMASGLLATGDCDVALATTGIAGPNSDGTQKPVGLCYIAAGTNEAVYVYKYIFHGTREEITQRAIQQALFLLYKQIK